MGQHPKSFSEGILGLALVIFKTCLFFKRVGAWVSRVGRRFYSNRTRSAESLLLFACVPGCVCVRVCI